MSDLPRLWQSTRALFARFASALLEEAELDECLDVIVASVGAERGLVVLRTEDGRDVVMYAPRATLGLTSIAREDASLSLLAEAALRGAPVLVAQGGDVAAVAVPVRALAVSGALYVDFRDPPQALGVQVELLESAAALLGAVFAQRRRRLPVDPQDVRASSAPPRPSAHERYEALAKARAKLDEEERALFESVTLEEGGVLSRVARALGVPRSTLVSRMEALGTRRVARSA